jgi:hypothetical protein
MIQFYETEDSYRVPILANVSGDVNKIQMSNGIVDIHTRFDRQCNFIAIINSSIS